MATNVVMPQMGESIAEGTIVRWIKKVGDHVDRDEPLFEISTDKVDAEIPSPSAGVLLAIQVKEGETVPVDSVVALIGDAGEKPAEEQSAAAPGTAAQAPGPPPPAPPERPVAAGEPPAEGAEAAPGRRKSSPLVRRIARDHDVNISRVQGSGIGGRVTKRDILAYIDGRPAGEARPAPGAPAFRPGEGVEVVPMSVMRRKIAEHMVLSKKTSAHVHSVFEVDYSHVTRLREQRMAELERGGTRLTYTAFIAKAVVDALRAMPVLNASIDGDNVVYHRDINLGIAVALDWGLIVPVVKQAGERNLVSLARAIADLGTRARGKQLKPEEVQGGTFTITNPGTFGALFGTPIINQPQVAILGVGTIEKRPVVIDDGIAIRPMGYLALGFDHRVVDGAVADQFMARVKKTLETFDPAA